jgi:PAS domain S-box-containing protein
MGKCIFFRPPIEIAHTGTLYIRALHERQSCWDMQFQKTILRYLFAIVAVAGTLALRIWLIPLTGTGAPFVFFGAVLATSLFAGVGPAICAVLLSLPLAAHMFVVRAGYPVFQAVFQSLLFGIDGLVVCYLTFLMRRGREAAEGANRQLRRANEELTNSEERFRLAIDEAPIGMALVSLDGRFVRVNRVLCEIVGYSAAELTSLTFKAITHPDDLETSVALADRFARGEIPRCQLEKRYIRKDGSVVEAMLSAAILPGRDGAPMYYISQIEDITERKRLERDLRLSEAKSSRIVSISADAIISIDENQCITLFNEGAEKIFGYSNGEAIGAQLEMLIPERFRATHREHVARFAGSEETARRMGYRDTAIFGLRKAVRNFRRTQPFRSWMSVANAS